MGSKIRDFPMPGGDRFGNEETALSPFIHELDLDWSTSKLCQDKDFAKAFVKTFPNKEEQKKYLLNTKKYSENKDFDPSYVLFFRRTLPSKNPSYEEHWTNEYVQARNGLKVEIPEGPHRFHSILLCDSLKHLLSYGGEKESGFTDGELAVNFPQYDQEKSLFKFKLQQDQEALNNYLKKEGALTQEQIVELIQQSKKRIVPGRLENKLLTLSMAAFVLGILLLSPSLTGNAIGILSNKPISFVGAGLLIFGLVTGFFVVKK
jgi:hypothetical protein